MKRYIRSTEYSASDLEPDESVEYNYSSKRKSDAELKQEIKEMCDNIDFIQVPIDLQAGLADPLDLRFQLVNYMNDIVNYNDTWYAIEFPDGKQAFYSTNRASTVFLQFLNGQMIEITKKNAKSRKTWTSVFYKHLFLENYIEDER